jgi:hypothetical protein
MAETIKASDLHVLSMPPAFVLSQDQTLMFILNPRRQTLRPSPSDLTAKRPFDRAAKRSNLSAQAPSDTLAAARASLPLPYNDNQHTAPHGTPGLTANGGSCHILAEARSPRPPKGSGRMVKIVPHAYAVQRRMNKNTAGSIGRRTRAAHHRPSARSSAMMRSGSAPSAASGMTTPAGASGGASAGVR